MTDNNNNNRNFTEEDERIMQERMLERRQQRAEQKKLQELKKQKNKQTLQKLVFAAKIFLAVVVVLSLLFVAARSLGNVTFSKAADYISQSISNLKPGDGYPVEVGSGKVKDMQSMGDCVALLRDDGIWMLNSTAKKTGRLHTLVLQARYERVLGQSFAHRPYNGQIFHCGHRRYSL